MGAHRAILGGGWKEVLLCKREVVEVVGSVLYVIIVVFISFLFIKHVKIASNRSTTCARRYKSERKGREGRWVEGLGGPSKRAE